MLQENMFFILEMSMFDSHHSVDSEITVIIVLLK